MTPLRPTSSIVSLLLALLFLCLPPVSAASAPSRPLSSPSACDKCLYAHADPVNGWDPSGHEFSIVGSVTAISTSEGLNTHKAGVETAVNWEIRDMARQLVNDLLPNDQNHRLGQEGEEVWARYLNRLPGFRAMRAPGLVTRAGPDLVGIAISGSRVALFIGEVKASEGRLPGVGALKWNIMNGMRQMSTRWLDDHVSDVGGYLLNLGLSGVADEQLRNLINEGSVELYLMGALKEWSGWRIRGFRLMHLGDSDVIPDIYEGGFPEITNEHVVH